jgi:hypothetical protein
MDDMIQKIFTDSEKAEFLETVAKELKDSRRAIVIFEKPVEKENKSDFTYYQLGFKQVYEVLGFLDWTKEMVIEDSEESDNE